MIEEIIPILLMMQRKGEDYLGGADHDTIYGPRDDTVTEEERGLMLENNWQLDTDVGRWAKFV